MVVAWHARFLRCGMVWLGLPLWEFGCALGCGVGLRVWTGGLNC